MESDNCSPIDRQEPPRPKAKGEENRRTRLEKGLPPELVVWLHRTTRVHAHLCSIVRLYGRPSQSGGQSSTDDGYAARAARGDRTLLFDALTVSRDELDEIRNEIYAAMESTPPTSHQPGTAGKVDVLAARFAAGDSLFVSGDAAVNVE